MKKATKLLSAVLIAISILISVPGMLPAAQAITPTSAAGIVNTSYGSLNVRASENASTLKLTALSKGTYVTLISRSGDWWKVEYASGRYGYVFSRYITNVWGTVAASVSVSGGSLNVRWGAGASYSVKTTLNGGQTVLILYTSNGWSKIIYNGCQVGYVSAKYLRSLMAWPAPASPTVSQAFSSGTHLGIDISARTSGVSGDSVIAVFGGTVVYSGWLGDYGYVVYVNSNFNGRYIQTRYAHLQSAPSVNVGETVGTGQAIGKMGSTGTSTGVHLHFEVRIRNSSDTCVANSQSTAINPLTYVSY